MTMSCSKGAVHCGAALLLVFTCAIGAADPLDQAEPRFSKAVAFDVSMPARDIAPLSAGGRFTLPDDGSGVLEVRPDWGPTYSGMGHSGDGALSGANNVPGRALGKAQVFANFEGMSNTDNFNLFGFRVNPPDPVGDVGRFHYVEMINLAVAVYDKKGNLLMGPIAIGDLWAGFPVEDCTDPSGDPIVVYDQLVNRWILSQFTTRGFSGGAPFYNCVAVSKTPDPTGEYYRYAFVTQPDSGGGTFFPDYPKYGVWTNSYILTTRDFGLNGPFRYGISVYALEKSKMISGQPNARAVQFFLEDGVVPLSLIGDGLLPPDIDGNRRPKNGAPAPILGSQDDDYVYGAAFDAINVFELSVKWKSNPEASLVLAAQLPTASFDSAFPCAPTARDCLPQPGIVNPAQFLDVQSYRQRLIHRLAYRNMGKYETLVSNQSVEARPGIAGVRWYEVRRSDGVYSIHQQGTYAPNDGVNRWMGSAAMDRDGNIAVGYSVVNGVDVYPGIRYTARMAGDPLGQMTMAETTIIDGSGVQTTTNSRWGDYTSLNLDPADDCTFWYVNEYYTAEGQATSLAGWQTRIASFRLPGCSASAR
ncbi:MAG: hypothetical protein GWP60_11300 [Gammaproteobacteria bacterium]|jgi:hypothetical protein|nr:hypothetical protein [Gammaproteobacteria bacterium]